MCIGVRTLINEALVQTKQDKNVEMTLINKVFAAQQLIISPFL